MPTPTAPVWTNSKAATVGTWVADAIKGRSANGPAEFRQVAEASTKGTTRVLVFTDGTARSFGVATKVFVAPAKPSPEVTPDPKPGKANPEAVARRAARHLANATPPVVADVPADAPAELAEQIEVAALGAATDRTERLALAKAEHATLQAWIKDGEKPPRPATPNLDAVNAAHAAGGKPKARQAKAAGPESEADRLFREAMDKRRAANNRRGPGAKTTPADLVALAADLRGRGLTQRRAQEVAYWLRGLQVSKSSWARAWDASAAA